MCLLPIQPPSSLSGIVGRCRGWLIPAPSWHYKPCILSVLYVNSFSLLLPLILYLLINSVLRTSYQAKLVRLAPSYVHKYVRSTISAIFYLRSFHIYCLCLQPLYVCFPSMKCKAFIETYCTSSKCTADVRWSLRCFLAFFKGVY